VLQILSKSIYLTLKKNIGENIKIAVKPIKAYNGKLHIEKPKIADLLSLCPMGLVPSTYYDFYKSLKST